MFSNGVNNNDFTQAGFKYLEYNIDVKMIDGMEGTVRIT